MIQMYYDFLKQQKKKGKISKWAKKKKWDCMLQQKKEGVPYSMLHAHDNK